MAQQWYPVIDYTACIDCGTCSQMCAHGVYDKEKSPSPVVKVPQNCVDRCHGCGNKCPVGAITYVGDDSAWIPPVLQSREAVDTAPAPGCGCGCK